MIRHIVWWTLKSHTDAKTADDNAFLILQASRELHSNPHAKSVEVSSKVEASSTVPAKVVMMATFETADKLQQFNADPITQRFEKKVADVATSKNCLDYDVLE